MPLFILMGELMNRSGMGERMYAVISRWIWFLPGGLIHTNIVSCAIFAACSGSSVATSATISRAALPSFRQRNYSERMVIGSLAAGGTLGILIPPSIGLILFGVLAEESVGRLYIAGFIPGLLLSVIFMLMIGIMALFWRGMAPRETGESFTSWESWKIRLVSSLHLLPVLALIFIVLGVIYLFTSSNQETLRMARTPSAEVVRDVVQRNVRIVQDSCISTVRTTGMIFLILMAAFTLSYAFARLGTSQQITEVIVGLNLTDWQLVLALIVFYLILGTFMESFAMMVTTVPILVPTLKAAEVDLVWFGVIMVLLVEAALISPPEGINLYVLHGVRQDIDREEAERTGLPVRESTISDVWIGVLPFMGCMAVTTALVLAFPQIALWLPDLIFDAR